MPEAKVKNENLKVLIWSLSVMGIAALTVFLPEVVLAAAENSVHHKSFSLAEEGFKFLNTLIVIAILYKVAAKPLSNFLKERRVSIHSALKEAETARNKAERQLEEQRAKVADLEAELDRVRKAGENERLEMRSRLEADQEAQAKRLLEQTRNAIELESAKARNELQDRAAELALGLAEEMLKKNIGPDDQGRFVSSYLSRLGTEYEGKQ